MEIPSASTVFSFIEYSFLINNCTVIDYQNISDNNIDMRKLSNLLNSHVKYPLWIDFNEICVDTANMPIQLDLLGHSNEPVILIESTDGSTIYFFKLKKSDTPEDMFCGKDQKHLIEKCLILWLSQFDKSNESELVDYSKYFYVSKNQIVKIDWLNDELTKRNLVVQNIYTKLFNYFLRDEITDESKISLSDSTLEYLQNSNFELSEIEYMAKEAYKTSLSLGSSPTDIRIRKYFLPEINSNKSLKTILPVDSRKILHPSEDKLPKSQLIPKPKPKSSKSEKTILLLDRYELAVKKLIQLKLPVMGKNIAKFCIPEISAPALTDSINKHRDRIIDCLKTYPDKWPLLRTNYQPIQKLTY